MRNRKPPTLPLVIAILALLMSPVAVAQDLLSAVTDSAGRRVEIPRQISRVLAAGPPASILLYTLAPEKMIGWVRTPSPAQKAFLLESVRELPAYGRLTGRGGTANLEVVITFKPDLIIDVASIAATYVSLANMCRSRRRSPTSCSTAGSRTRPRSTVCLVSCWA